MLALGKDKKGRNAGEDFFYITSVGRDVILVPSVQRLADTFSPYARVQMRNASVAEPFGF